MTIGSFVLALALSGMGSCSATIRYTGVNLAGAEFGGVPTPGNLGTYGSSYMYPTASEVDTTWAKG